MYRESVRKMKTSRFILALIAIAILVVPSMAYDQRSGSHGVPYIPPDPSLKTTDPFYVAIMDRQYGSNSASTNSMDNEDPWAGILNSTDPTKPLNSSNSSLNSTPKPIVDALPSHIIQAASINDLTDAQIQAAGLKPGQGSWL
jgi:hypothetical protein